MMQKRKKPIFNDSIVFLAATAAVVDVFLRKNSESFAFRKDKMIRTWFGRSIRLQFEWSVSHARRETNNNFWFGFDSGEELPNRLNNCFVILWPNEAYPNPLVGLSSKSWDDCVSNMLSFTFVEDYEAYKHRQRLQTRTHQQNRPTRRSMTNNFKCFACVVHCNIYLRARR